MSRITSITIKNYSCGMHTAEEITCHVTTVYRTGKIKHCLFNGLSVAAVKEYEYIIDKQQCEAFFEFLSDEVKINEWLSATRGRTDKRLKGLIQLRFKYITNLLFRQE